MTPLNSMSRLWIVGALLLGSAMSSAVQASTCVWIGTASVSWSVTTNWSNCAGSVPVNGDTLQFPALASNKNTNHNLAALNTVAGIQFSGASGNYTLSGMGLSIGAGGIVNSNTAGSNLINMDLTLAAAQSFSGGDNAMVLSGSLDLNGKVLTLTWDASSGPVPLTIQSAITGGGSIQVQGLGLLTGLVLSGDNNFTGPVTISSGNTLLSHSHALGSADGSAVNGTSVTTGGSLQLGTNLSIGNEALALASGMGQGGRGQLRFLGTNNWGGPVQLSGPGTSRVTSSSAGSTLIFNSIVSGVGGLEIGLNSDVAVQLNNVGNSFTGGVTTMALTPAQGAILRLGGDLALPAGALLALNGNSIFDLNGFDANLAGLSCTSSDSVALGFGSALTINNSGTQVTCSGLLFGNVSTNPTTVLNKLGSGTMTLTADSSYSGEVDVLGGGLEINGGLVAHPSSAIFVSSGQNASLYGNGIVGNIVSSGIVHGGSEATPGTLFANFVSFVGLGRLSARLQSDSSYDQINATNVSLTSAQLLLDLSYQPLAGSVFMLINNVGANAVTGAFTGLPQGTVLNVGSTPMVISYIGGTGNDVTLSVLPSTLFKDGFE